jgi:hypothetical protein
MTRACIDGEAALPHLQASVSTRQCRGWSRSIVLEAGSTEFGRAGFVTYRPRKRPNVGAFALEVKRSCLLPLRRTDIRPWMPQRNGDAPEEANKSLREVATTHTPSLPSLIQQSSGIDPFARKL